MIKLEDCEEFRITSRITNFPNVELEYFMNCIKEQCEEYQLPVEVKYNTLKSGGIFSSTKIDCLVITNTKHRYDYSEIIISISRQG